MAMPMMPMAVMPMMPMAMTPMMPMMSVPIGLFDPRHGGKRCRCAFDRGSGLTQASRRTGLRDGSPANHQASDGAYSES